MASISVGGIGSGLDINGLVDQLVAAERTPTANRLDVKEARLQAQFSSFGTLKGALSQFKSVTSKLSLPSTFNSRSASSSNEGLLTASASSLADAGSYTVEVTQLAQTHALATASGQFTELTDEVGTGTLTINFGTTDYDSGTDTYNSFTQNPDSDSLEIDITSANNTLQGVRDAINAADGGVRASIVSDGDGYRLLLTAESGADNSIEISVSDDDANDTDSSGLSQLAFNASATNMEQTLEGLDAELSVNGLAVTSSSNTVSGVIQGVTLNLKSADVGSPAEVVVSHDTSATSSAIEDFVTAYNGLISTLDAIAGYDADSGQGGVLLGDSAVRGMSTQIRREMLSPLPSSAGAYLSLADIGITTQKDGTLAIDNATLSSALDENFDDIATLFAARGNPSDSQIEYISSSSNTEVGVYDINISQMPSDGVDVAGTIGGFEATGDGSFLTGAGSASGLVISVVGGDTGDRGSVNFTRGVADRLNTLLGDLLSSDGILASRTEGLQERIDRVNSDRDALDVRIADIEERYRKQFTSLDTLLGQMQATSDWLASQLASLPVIGQSNN